jgi:hypothetical protein
MSCLSWMNPLGFVMRARWGFKPYGTLTPR